MNKRYIARGYVLGKLWGDGIGAYPSRTLETESIDQLKVEAMKGIKEGWLDSGMGFECLLGARLVIETIESLKKGKKTFFNSSYKVAFFGDLTPKEKHFLGTLGRSTLK